jgi:hypothetical protein
MTNTIEDHQEMTPQERENNLFKVGHWTQRHTFLAPFYVPPGIIQAFAEENDDIIEAFVRAEWEAVTEKWAERYLDSLIDLCNTPHSVTMRLLRLQENIHKTLNGMDGCRMAMADSRN